MKRTPTISLIRFRSVSKQWKSLIDSSKFIKDHSQYQHRILARYMLESDSDLECECFSFIKNDNDDVFPNQKSSLTLPLLISSFNDIKMYNSVNGFLRFKGYIDSFKTSFAVFWNPTVGKSVSIKIPHGLWSYIGFGFCPYTFDPKLVVINIAYDTFRCEDHVFIKGCIYWLAADYSSREFPNVIFSFDLKSKEFSKVRLPGRLSQTGKLEVVEVNESLGVLEYGGDGGCCVWIMEFVTKSFTKMFTVKVPDQLLCNRVLEFRKIGDNKYRLEA
ncbi:putative pentatricopeptide repeat-containing protein [Tanacetum coccineum]